MYPCCQKRRAGCTCWATRWAHISKACRQQKLAHIKRCISKSQLLYIAGTVDVSDFVSRWPYISQTDVVWLTFWALVCRLYNLSSTCAVFEEFACSPQHSSPNWKPTASALKKVYKGIADAAIHRGVVQSAKAQKVPGCCGAALEFCEGNNSRSLTGTSRL